MAPLAPSAAVRQLPLFGNKTTWRGSQCRHLGRTHVVAAVWPQKAGRAGAILGGHQRYNWISPRSNWNPFSRRKSSKNHRCLIAFKSKSHLFTGNQTKWKKQVYDFLNITLRTSLFQRPEGRIHIIRIIIWNHPYWLLLKNHQMCWKWMGHLPWLRQMIGWWQKGCCYSLSTHILE